MSEPTSDLSGPDLANGIELSALASDSLLLGHAHGEAVLLARSGHDVFAVGATCTHYGGPLAEGLRVGDSVRCPWHHACFSLRSGEAERAPALNPIPCLKIEQRDGKVWVLQKLQPAAPQPSPARPGAPQAIVIVGGGAAGNAAAEMLRRKGYAGRLTMLSADESLPYDRPNLSKNYLAGTAPEDWIPLRALDFYREHDIDLRLATQVDAIDTRNRQLTLADGSRCDYDALLLATGADPVRLDLPGANLPHVHCLRTLADSRALIGEAQPSRRAVVVGTGFIGLEVAAALRARQVEVDVVGPDPVPMQAVLGAELGQLVRKVHEAHGVRFHLGTTPRAIDARRVTLHSGEVIDADFVVIGVGVDDHLQTSVPGVYAAGDIARWPDRLSGQRIRVEHWVVAERQGQIAARNMLGDSVPFDAVPFFWTEQHDLTIAYVGHAEGWDRADVKGDVNARDCTVTYRRNGKALAMATVGRDLESLKAELAFERGA